MIQRTRFSQVLFVSLFVLGLTALPAAAGVVTYRVFNHPDGNAIDVDVDTDGYALRLDIDGTQHTFNANTTSGLFFSFDTEGTTASLSGTVEHNESGQLWEIDAAFSGLALGSDSVTPWHSSSTLYDDIVADLLNEADLPSSPAERSIVTDFDDVDRIYFEFVNMSLTPLSPDPQQYPGPTEWNEHPDTGQFADDKFFYLQYRWRLWGSEYESADYDLVAGAGWLEPASGPRAGENIKGSQDFLFVLGDRVTTPEPGSALVLLLGCAALGARRRRRA